MTDSKISFIGVKPMTGTYLEQYKEVTEGMSIENRLQMAEAFLALSDSLIERLRNGDE
jgi:hypothetical protein